MPTKKFGRRRAGRFVAVLAGILALSAIAFLTWNVTREIAAQSSAQSDNVQHSLSQTEVEFQEFANRLRLGTTASEITRRFDIFYGRITTVRQAEVFSDLRDDPTFTNHLSDIEGFLEQAVPLIDVSEVELIQNLPRLTVLSQTIRPSVRGLSIAGLKIFAEKADAQREAVARTLTQLALALASLIAALGIGVAYLVRLNKQISLREREQVQTATRINTIMNTALDGVIVSDGDGRITGFNAAAEQIFGHKARDVMGKSIGPLIVPDHLVDAHEAGMARIRSGGEPRVVGKGRVQLEAKHADGTLFPLELAIQSAVTDEEDIYIAFLRDVSKQVADQQELIEARDKAIAGEQSRSEFLATMSHEIRTPLNGLLGNMSLMRDTPLSARQDTYLRHMETSGRLLMSHVSDVLDIARYDSGKISVRAEPMNISALVQDIIDNQSATAAAQNTTLEWGWDGPAQHWIKGDCDRIQHVLINLIGNAVKFTQDGRITVTLAWCDGRLDVMIEDTGIGIAPELLGTVFDDFVTGDTSYDRKVSGTGLGLGIVRRFVEALEGEIDVQSTQGVGSSFAVSLPAPAAKETRATTAYTAQVKAVKPQKILIVEDNEINRFVVNNMLQADGHSVTEAVNGKEGVEIANAEKFDLILMDISMPVMDGRAATAEIRAGNGASAKSRIIALTANVLPEEQADFLAIGMDAILTKPLTKPALQAALTGTPPQAEPPRSPLIDMKHLDETNDTVGDEAFAVLLDKFDVELSQIEGWLTPDAAPETVAAMAHKVAGSATLFGAVQLRKALLELEQNAKAKDTEGVATKRPHILALCADTREALTLESLIDQP